MHKQSEAKTNWSSRSIGSDWQHRAFYRAIQLGGRRAAYFMLYFVVAWYVLFSPLARKRASYYLARRFPASSAIARLWHCYRLILEFGKVLVDRAVVGILGPESLAVSLAGRDELLKLRDENHGLILMTAHVGCWQVAMSALGFLQRPVHMLMRREDGDIDRHYYEHAGIPCPYQIIDPTGYLGGTLEMLAVLKQGQILSVMGDRRFGSDKSATPVNFFGEPAALPFSAYKLAAATGAPLVVFFTRKDGPKSYQVHLAKVIRVPPIKGRSAADFAPFAQEFADALEDFSRRYPYQFYNFYNMWSPQQPQTRPTDEES